MVVLVVPHGLQVVLRARRSMTELVHSFGNSYCLLVAQVFVLDVECSSFVERAD